MSLSWDDIFIQEGDIDFASLLSRWPFEVEGKVLPVGLSAFGDIYFMKENGIVYVVDVLECGLSEAADSMDEFKFLMGSTDWVQESLMADVVAALKYRGLERGKGQVFGFSPHPSFVGKIDPDTAIVLDIPVWNEICSQIGPAKSSA